MIGGGEAREDTKAITKNKDINSYDLLRELIPKKRNRKNHIEIITTASSVPDKVKKNYVKAFKKIGFTRVGFMYVGNSLKSHNQKFIK